MWLRELTEMSGWLGCWRMGATSFVHCTRFMISQVNGYNWRALTFISNPRFQVPQTVYQPPEFPILWIQVQDTWFLITYKMKSKKCLVKLKSSVEARTTQNNPKFLEPYCFPCLALCMCSSSCLEFPLFSLPFFFLSPVLGALDTAGQMDKESFLSTNYWELGREES